VTDTEPKRAQRVGELIKQELGRMLVGELKDPRIGFATVMEVRVTGDLRQARVYVSVYGTKEARAASLDGLKAAAGYVKRELGKSLRLRFTPEILFCEDDTLDRAERMDELMQAIATGKTEVPKPHASEPLPVATDRSELATVARGFEVEPPPEPAAKRGRRRRLPPKGRR